MIEENNKKNPSQVGRHRDLNQGPPKFESSVMNFDRRYALCVQNLYHRPHFTVGDSWNKSLHLQPLQRCYFENSGSPASSCLMLSHYSITYTQSLHTINGLLAVGREGNLLCGRPSYITLNYLSYFKLRLNYIRGTTASKKSRTTEVVDVRCQSPGGEGILWYQSVIPQP